MILTQARDPRALSGLALCQWLLSRLLALHFVSRGTKSGRFPAFCLFCSHHFQGGHRKHQPVPATTLPAPLTLPSRGLASRLGLNSSSVQSSKILSLSSHLPPVCRQSATTAWPSQSQPVPFREGAGRAGSTSASTARGPSSAASTASATSAHTPMRNPSFVTTVTSPTRESESPTESSAQVALSSVRPVMLICLLLPSLGTRLRDTNAQYTHMIKSGRTGNMIRIKNTAPVR